MVYAKPKMNPGEWDALCSPGLWGTNGSPNLSQRRRHSDNQQQKQKKGDKYQDLARELKKTMKHEVDSDTNSNRCTRNKP